MEVLDYPRKLWRGSRSALQPRLWLRSCGRAHLCAQVPRAEDVSNLARHQQRLELGRQVRGTVRLHQQ